MAKLYFTRPRAQTAGKVDGEEANTFVLTEGEHAEQAEEDGTDAGGGEKVKPRL